MKDRQRTIKKEFSLSGIGLHTGHKANVTFKPAEEGSGMRFIRTDVPDKTVIRVCEENVVTENRLPRCTSIKTSGEIIHTVEHLLGVLCGLRIDNLDIEIDNDELPGLDGSGLDFLKALKKAGLQEQKSFREYCTLREPIGVERNGSSVFIAPADDFRISYTLDYEHPVLRSQFFSTVVTEDTFEKKIAPSRTFCLEEEAEELRKNGLGKGANYTNTLVVTRDGVKSNTVRFENEFARHKVLDLIGDIYLLGKPVRGHVFAVKSGHSLNLELMRRIDRQRIKYEKDVFTQEYDLPDGQEIDIEKIMRILPHRFPFLLVDRVIELDKGKKAIGLKNVTINDNFFQGHFPSRPVMPGVLMIEAMAQTAGVAVLSNPEHQGKVAFFMGVDKVKFRKVVVPGDQLLMDVEVIRDRSRTVLVQGRARVGKEIVAEAEMLFSFTDASYLS